MRYEIIADPYLVPNFDPAFMDRLGLASGGPSQVDDQN
jgi:hypothetical protein